MEKEHETFFHFWQDRNAWARASRNTFYCLIGCNIGDFATMIVAQIYYQQTPMLLLMALATVNGLITSVLMETTILRLREKFSWGRGLKMAFQMSFLSMVVMELAENTTDFFLTTRTLLVSNPWYWIALLISSSAGFLVPLPYNYYKFKRRGESCCH